MKSRFSKPVLFMILLGCLLVVFFNSYLGAKYSTREGLLGGGGKPPPKEKKMYMGTTFRKTAACKMSASDSKKIRSTCGSTTENNAQSLCHDLTEAGKDIGVSCVGIDVIPFPNEKVPVFYPVSNLPSQCLGPQNQNYLQGLKGIPMKTTTYKDPETGASKKHGIYDCDAPEYSKFKACCNVVNTLNGPNEHNNSLSDSQNPMSSLNSYGLDEPKADWATSKTSWLKMFSSMADKLYSIPYKAPSSGSGSVIVGMP